MVQVLPLDGLEIKGQPWEQCVTEPQDKADTKVLVYCYPSVYRSLCVATHQCWESAAIPTPQWGDAQCSHYGPLPDPALPGLFPWLTFIWILSHSKP